VSRDPELARLRGARLLGIRWDAHRAQCGFELQDPDGPSTLVIRAIQYSRFEFEECAELEVVALDSIQAEPCPLGIRLFGELSNGTFEFVCTNFRIEHPSAHDVA
jgi:hypothetical protein